VDDEEKGLNIGNRGRLIAVSGITSPKPIEKSHERANPAAGTGNTEEDVVDDEDEEGGLEEEEEEGTLCQCSSLDPQPL
jgi:hypothetical protein